ncbi:uncharacterized protein LOC127148589 [Cucumis melo]|uniref:Uncharacterized protein LOC127148589 n=1 Tax=Cucumis melo TaxID=3656 RepID=A0ABM3KLI9_CUCME|nr:uncharacterized protein LOC127148589 [Cucumis melo]
MVRRSERCLESRLKKIKSSKDNPILIEDNAGNNEGQTSHDVPENFSSESDEVSKKRKFENDVRASEQKKMKKSDKKEAKRSEDKKRGEKRMEQKEDYEVVDNHHKWKDLAEKVFDNDKAMFEEDFVERRTFHENVMREETNVTFERGESSRQGETSNEKIPNDFLKFQELILANNECLNNKLDKLIREAKSLKDMLKEKVNQTVENNDNIPMDDNNDEGEGDTHNENVEHEVQRDKRKLGKILAQRPVPVRTASTNAYQQAVRKSIRRGTLPSQILRSPYTTKFGSTEPKKERIEFNAQ